MPTVLLAGVPEKWSRRVKAALVPIAEEGTWAVKVFPSPSELPEIRFARLQQLLDEAIRLNGPHIIGFQQTDNRTAIAEQVRQHFRFRWGDASVLKAVNGDTDHFRAEIRAVLEEEERWRENVMPCDKSSPLILPANVFTTLPKHKDVWGQSEMYGREPEHFIRLAKKLKHFQQEHTKNYPGSASFMVDRSGLVWKDAGPYHAKTPTLRRWKYSYQLIDKFHFDVEHQKGGAFKIRDSANVEISVDAKKHANIDCHGFQSH